MKKALISAAAVAALGFAGAAQAQVTAYGLFDISAGKSLLGDARGNDVSLNAGGNGSASEGNSTTRFGLKGAADVGSGIKANFNYQAGIDGDGATNSSTTLFNRQAWAGLSGGFGEFRFGKQDNVPFQTFINLDYNGASNGVSVAAYSGAGLWASFARQGNSLQYITPSLGGLTVQVGFQKNGSRDYTDGNTLDEDAGDDPDDSTTWTGADDKDTKDIGSAGLTFVAGPVTIAAAFQSKETDDGDAYSGFGLQYDFGAFKAKVDAHKMGDKSGVNLGAVTTVASWTVGAQYSLGTDETGAEDVKTSGYELFVNKEILKNVYGYAEVGSITADEGNVLDGDSDSATGFAVGMILVF